MSAEGNQASADRAGHSYRLYPSHRTIKQDRVRTNRSFFRSLLGFILLFIGRFGLGNSFRIGSPRESTRLRVDGLFRISRNPMYLGVYCTLLATVLRTLNPVLLLVAAFIAAVHHRIVLAEETHLRNAFGKEYGEYCSRVKRYL